MSILRRRIHRVYWTTRMMAVRIEPFLLEHETLLGSLGSDSGLVCATDQRLLKVDRGVLGRRVRDLSYREITSIAIVDEVSRPLILTGGVLAGLGASLPRLAPLLLPWLDASRSLRFTVEGAYSVWFVAIALVTLGLLAVALAIGRRRCVITFDGPSLLRDRAHRRAWRFVVPTPSDGRVFALIVRSRLAEHSAIGEKKVLPHDSI